MCDVVEEKNPPLISGRGCRGHTQEKEREEETLHNPLGGRAKVLRVFSLLPSLFLSSACESFFRLLNLNNLIQ